MKFKSGVIVEKKQGKLILSLEKESREVLDEDGFIVQALIKDVEKEDELVNLVVKHDKTSLILANLRMAQFVIDYGDYLSNEIGHMIIEP